MKKGGKHCSYFIVAVATVTTITTTSMAAVAARTRKRVKAIIRLRPWWEHDDHDEDDVVVQTKLYSFRLDCNIVSFTAANTNLMFSVSVAHVKCE